MNEDNQSFFISVFDAYSKSDFIYYFTNALTIVFVLLVKWLPIVVPNLLNIDITIYNHYEGTKSKIQR